MDACVQGGEPDPSPIQRHMGDGPRVETVLLTALATVSLPFQASQKGDWMLLSESVKAGLLDRMGQSLSLCCWDDGCHASGGQAPLLVCGLHHPHQIFFPEIPELTACPPEGSKERPPGLTAPTDFRSQAMKVVGIKPGEWPPRRPVLSRA